MPKKKPNQPINTERQTESNRAGEYVIGLDRHRIGVDGKGITALVAFHGCNLRCKFCLNPQCFSSPDGLRKFTPESLYIELKNDDLYYRASGGGVCFGGGEPLLKAAFISRFREICGNQWTITVETSLNAPYPLVESLASVVDEWIVDIKTGEPESYRAYTGGDFFVASDNLRRLVEECHVSPDKILIRIPIIPGFTDEQQALTTQQIFRNRGFNRFDIFSYRAQISGQYCENGKAKCELLKSVRKEIADANGIEYEPHECTHSGDCPGTCPLCEFELEKLSADINRKGNVNLELSEETRQKIDNKVDGSDLTPDSSDTDGSEGMCYGEVPPLPPGLPAPGPIEGELYVPPPPRKKVLFKECPIAGISFHIEYDDELWDELEVGQEVALVRDRKNKFDPDAVAVALKDDYDGDPDNFDFDFILGYLPKSENSEIARMLDMGWEDVFFTTLSTVKTHGYINNRLRISIFIQSKEPEIPEPDRLRLQSLDTADTLRKLEELETRGALHFRWGGYPVWERELPHVGDEVVLIGRIGSKAMLMLTRIVAKGDDCISFFDRDDVFAVDDCECFALSNVVGPLYVEIDRLDFLDKKEIDSHDVFNKLSVSQAAHLRKIFHGYLHPFDNNLDSDSTPDDPRLV